MSDESVEEFQEGMHGLPTDFDINANLSILSQQLEHVPLTEYFHNLILDLERKRVEKSGRTLHYYFIYDYDINTIIVLYIGGRCNVSVLMNDKIIFLCSNNGIILSLCIFQQ